VEKKNQKDLVWNKVILAVLFAVNHIVVVDIHVKRNVIPVSVVSVQANFLDFVFVEKNKFVVLVGKKFENRAWIPVTNYWNVKFIDASINVIKVHARNVVNTSQKHVHVEVKQNVCSVMLTFTVI
jgi:hypothetical protein